MSENKNGLTRRELLVAAVAGAVIAPLATTIISNAAYAADVDDSKMVKDSDPVAKALKYVPDSSKATGKVDKLGVKAADQKCSNCALFAAQGKHKNGKEVGKCTMIAGGLVYAAGYCNSWAKKA